MRDPAQEQPLTLFLWGGNANFGDELSRIIVEYVSGRTVRVTGPFKAELYGIGSILKHAEYGTEKGRRHGPPPWIWGSGFMSAMKITFRDRVRIAAVRGKKTARVLGVSDVPMGDPGILTAEAFGKPVSRRRPRIGVVPHWRTVEALQAHLGHTDEVLLIDPRNSPEVVLPQLASCEWANVFRDVFASITDIVGGRSGAYEKSLQEARETALRELEERAAMIGANAVVGVDLDYEVVNNMLMVSASGTAVTIG